VIPAIAFTVILCALVVFQVALASGAPWGRFAWGGQHAGVLPRRLRIASGVSVIVYVVLAVPALAQVAAWVVFGYLCLGVVMNAISRSAAERAVMTPVAAVLALLAFIVAFSGSVSHEYAGLVLDDGNRAVFCTTILESHPPQCGGDSPVVLGWDWDAVSGVLDGNTLRVTGRDRETVG
jgi:hypothetical protein